MTRDQDDHSSHDDEARGRAVAARAYNAVALEVHFACVVGREPTEEEKW